MIPVQTRVRGSRPAALLSEGYGYIVNKMNTILGGDYWRGIIVDYKAGSINSYQAEERLTLEFCNRLKESFRYVINMPIRAKDGHNPKYRMIHATNHPDGCVLMADNMYKRSNDLRIDRQYGQLSLFKMGADDGVFSEEETIQNLLSIIPSEETRLTEIQANYFTQFGVTCSSSKLTSILMTLEAEGHVMIRRNPPLTHTGKTSTFRTENRDHKIYLKRAKQ